jgi:CxxC motif-containing protein (DUF1111 family)
MGHNTAPRASPGIGTRVWLRACAIVVILGSIALAGDRGRRSQTLIPRDFFEGKELFERVWEPGVRSETGGDGLGPLYNESSCAGCHHLGGTGGGGESKRDVVMLTAVASPGFTAQGDSVFQGALEALHPGFHKRTSIVLHRHATSPTWDERLTRIASFTAVQNRDEFLALRRGRRNTLALFGAGLIDAVPDGVLRKAEKRAFTNFPEIHGRASELPNGRLGRFGWKAQMAHLDDFVRAACSNELGLEVPGHHQATLAPVGELDAAKPLLDMDESQCELLTSFVARLAPPVRWVPGDRTLSPWGYMAFESIGCATCHAPTLGDARGLYSDLLLHDMGESSADSATYYGAPVETPRSDNLAANKQPARPSGMATATEWRTAPLWGVADSAPYLHDGRAATLDDAIRRHDGEAAKSANRYIRLAASDRRAVLSFLSSLTVSSKSRPRNPSAAKRKPTTGPALASKVVLPSK